MSSNTDTDTDTDTDVALVVLISFLAFFFILLFLWVCYKVFRGRNGHWCWHEWNCRWGRRTNERLPILPAQNNV